MGGWEEAREAGSGDGKNFRLTDHTQNMRQSDVTVLTLSSHEGCDNIRQWFALENPCSLTPMKTWQKIFISARRDFVYKCWIMIFICKLNSTFVVFLLQFIRRTFNNHYNEMECRVQGRERGKTAELIHLHFNLICQRKPLVENIPSRFCFVKCIRDGL